MIIYAWKLRTSRKSSDQRIEKTIGTLDQGCSEDRLDRDQDRERKILPRPKPVFVSTLASRPRPAKFGTKTETGKNDVFIVFF